MPVSPNEADVILNRANVALAKSQRLIASWLPSPSEEELASSKGEAEIEQQDEEIFAPVPEVLGLGASLPQYTNSASLKNRHLSSNDALKKKLLGKNVNRVKFNLRGVSTGKQIPMSYQKPATTEANNEDEADEGRSSLGKGKQRAREQAEGNTNLKDYRVSIAKTAVAKKPRSYLDEILSERSRKKIKKRL